MDSQLDNEFNAFSSNTVFSWFSINVTPTPITPGEASRSMDSSFFKKTNW